ncbi:MAG: polyamine aminopropyltransferase [Pseudomonadota bacterium]
MAKTKSKDKNKSSKKLKGKDKAKSSDKDKLKKSDELWFEETFHPEWRVRFRAEDVLHEIKTEHQHLVIFDNKTWGRCLLLDGVFQLTTSDEFIYHEMMAHIPLMSHERPKSVLVIGGGDGGVLREVLKHPSVERAVLCEIDREVIDTSLKYYPQISDGAFDDPRTEVAIGDGYHYVRDTSDTFEAIIVDSSEPIGPSAILHSPEFFEACDNALSPNGILMAQNGLPFSAPDHLARVTTTLAKRFKSVAPCLATQPCYFGGSIAMNTATNGTAPNVVPVRTLASRATRRKVKTRYWTPALHNGAFALPGYIQTTVETALKTAKKR